MSLSTALACVERGWPCFPVRAEDKVPLVKWGTEASTESDTIRRWFGWRRPEPVPGIVCGQRSGLYVIDVDDPSAPAREGVDLSQGRSVPSRREGGMHYYFRPPVDGRPVPSSAGGGIDVRGDGGMVIAWHGLPEGTLQPLPGPVAEWARSRSGGSSGGPTPAEVWPEGDRHDRLVRIAAAARNMAGGATEGEILGVLRVFNASRCVPVLADEWLEPIARSYAGKDSGNQYRNYDDVIAMVRSRRTVK